MIYLENFFNDILDWMLNFNAFSSLFLEKKVIAFIIFNCLSISCIVDYLGTIFEIKKSYKATKIIAKKYKVWQRIWLIHYYENVYRKVDRLYFNFVYHFYHVYLIVMLLVIVCAFVSIVVPIFNQITFALICVNVILWFLTVIVYFLATKGSPLGGVEFRSEAKYRGKKNW